MNTKQAIVIGAGMSGIAAASYLRRAGIATVILESSDTIGGRVGCVPFGERHVELGGRNVQSNPQIMELLKSHGIVDFDGYSIDSVPIGSKHQLDFRQTGGKGKRALRLMKNLWRLGPRTLMRVNSLAKMARNSENGSQIGSPLWRELAESHADPSLVHYFGALAAEGVFRPWTIRTMGSEPEEVYLGNIAPILGRGKAPILRVRGGMNAFFQAAAKHLDIRLGHRVHQLLIEDGQVAGVVGEAEGGVRFSVEADIVVIALPAGAAARLVADAMPSLSRTLQNIVYRPVATLVATYRSAEFPGGLGGIFLPRGVPVSHISRQSGADGTTLRYTLAGVAARPWLRPDVTEAELFEIAEQTMRQFGGQLGERIRQVSRVWLPGVCAQSWMHHRTLAEISTAVGKVKGLGLAGDYFQSASMDGCVASAERNVKEALSRLE